MASDAETQAANDAIRAEVAAAKNGTTSSEPPQGSATVTTATVTTDDNTQDAPLGEAGEKALEAFKARAREAEKEARALAARVKEFEDRDKSEQEKLEERASTAEQRAIQAEARMLRFEVAFSKQLPAELAERLQGSTKEELEADADRLLELVKPNGRPSGDVDAGRGEGGGGMSFNELLRARARA